MRTSGFLPGEPGDQFHMQIEIAAGSSQYIRHLTAAADLDSHLGREPGPVQVSQVRSAIPGTPNTALILRGRKGQRVEMKLRFSAVIPGMRIGEKQALRGTRYLAATTAAHTHGLCFHLANEFLKLFIDNAICNGRVTVNEG